MFRHVEALKIQNLLFRLISIFVRREIESIPNLPQGLKAVKNLNKWKETFMSFPFYKFSDNK